MLFKVLLQLGAGVLHEIMEGETVKIKLETLFQTVRTKRN